MTAARRQSLLWLAFVWVISAALLVTRIDRGWVAHDEGTIAHPAERVLAGELPHRDFDDVYTGGLAYLNAAAMRAFGLDLRSPRILLVAAFLLCVPVFYYAATRFGSPPAAAIVTLLAVVWSVPNYLAAMPSWYNVIFGILGIAALLRFVETDRRRWLLAAGLCGGLSFLIKLVGLYFVAGALLFLVLREQHDSAAAARERSGEPVGAASALLYPAFVAASLVAFVVAVGVLISAGPGIDIRIHFLVPGAAVAAALLWSERTLGLGRAGVGSAERFARLLRLAAPFVAGVVIPVVIFLAPYVASGAVGDLVHGVFVAPSRRLSSATFMPLSWQGGLPTLVLAGLVVAARWSGARRAQVLAIGVAIVGLVAVVLSATEPSVYRMLFRSVVLLPVIAVVGGAALVAGLGRRSGVRRQRVMVVAAAMATFTLIQFPFSAPIYFCYVTPLLALLALALISELEMPSLALPGAVAATLVVFGVTRVNPGYIWSIGALYAPYQPLAALEIERAGGVRVPESSSRDYTRLVAVLREHAAGPDAYVYAAPDAPEVYFLTGLRNPTRTLYDFFDDPAERTARVLRALRERDVRVVAINREPGFSAPVEGELRAALERDYPIGGFVGRFEVRWREQPWALP